MKKILGLDLGTNSIGWALTHQDFENKKGEIIGLGSRIIPMDGGQLSKFEQGTTVSQTADRTTSRGVRRLYQRNKLRRERLHRVLNILNFLPSHYSAQIDFQNNLGKFKPNTEPKINYFKNGSGKFEFLFINSFDRMLEDFKKSKPELFEPRPDGTIPKIPYDWTIYFLRQKALKEAVSKEELAWIILNFNQKRGYYQLRGEELDEDKNKQYVQLKVKNVVDSGEKNRGNILYDVTFENGWKYDRPITRPEEWVGRWKEFIVTITTKKDGELKYSYKSVEPEDWAVIKAKTEQDIEESGKTVGQFIYENLLNTPDQKIRGELIKTIERKFYKKELKAILDKQIELQPDLFTKSAYQKCILELYPNNEGHRKSLEDKGFTYLFLEDIIFYQRPLKSQKSNIARCQFEYRRYKKVNKENGNEETVKEYLPVISKSHPLYQEFRLWQWLHNLKIYEKEQKNGGQINIDVDVTKSFISNPQDVTDLFDFLSSRKNVEQKHLMDYFIKKGIISKGRKDDYRWNYVEDKPYPCFETRALFIERLKKVKGLENPVDFLQTETRIGKKDITREEQLWHIVYSVSDRREFESALGKFASKHDLDKDSFVENFKKHPPYDSDYGSFSKKALNKIVLLMRVGKFWNKEVIDNELYNRYAQIKKRVDSLGAFKGLKKDELSKKIESVSDNDIPKSVIKSFLEPNEEPLSGLKTSQACYLIYGRLPDGGDIQQWKSPMDIENYLKQFKQHSLRNPIVEQVVTETLRVVQDIWATYGNSKEGFFDEIHVELGRDMKNSNEKRKKISQRNTENENTNTRIRSLLKELMADASIEGDVRDFSPSHQEILKIYEEGVYQNPNADFGKMNEDEIKRLRRTNNPSKKDIARYKLWLEQGYISPYTGKIIRLSELFTKKYEIEHIIPRSRFFDDSLSNKIICEAVVNEDKSNKTAAEYLKKKGGEIVEGYRLLRYEEYQEHVNRYFRKNRTKLKNLLSEDIPEGFINRQLNDSRYISKFVKNLLSNIVRQEGEREAIAKNLIPVTGAVTSKLKNEWGLNDIWNQLILPRFERLNELTKSEDFTAVSSQGHIIPTVPDELLKGFNKKRIDHRHHALDALVVACTTRDHTNYLSSLNAESENYSLKKKLLIINDKGDFTKHFQLPWNQFPKDALDNLTRTVVSFKQNLRVINKANNKFWSYKGEKGNLNIGKNGKPVKKLRKQVKGDNWAIRKALHEPMPYNKVYLDFEVLDIYSNVGKYELIIDKKIREAVKIKFEENSRNTRKTKNHLKENPLIDENGKPIIKTHFRIKVEKYGKRKPIETLSGTNYESILKNIYKVGDYQTQLDLIEHLNRFLDSPEEAFSNEGINQFNRSRELKNKKPVHKIRICKSGSKRFALGHKVGNSHKWVQATDGTNLFFAVYWDEKKKKRNFETVPLNEVIAHQKQVAHLPANQRTPIQPNPKLGKFLFTLSPNDLVYLPTEDEFEASSQIDFSKMSTNQIGRIYKMVKATGKECYFIAANISKLLVPYNSKMKIGEFGSQNVSEKDFSDTFRIKEKCIKINVNRIGIISKA